MFRSKCSKVYCSEWYMVYWIMTEVVGYVYITSPAVLHNVYIR